MSDKPGIDAVLERVAWEATTVAQRSGEGCWGNVAEVLERRLKPLLEAGQAMRDRVGAPPYGGISGGMWDAALREASKP